MLLCEDFSSCSKCRLLSSCGVQAFYCSGFSYCGPWALGSVDSVVVEHRLSCSVACGIFPDQGLNPCPLHWHADAQPLDHQGSPFIPFLVPPRSAQELRSIKEKRGLKPTKSCGVYSGIRFSTAPTSCLAFQRANSRS